MIRSVLFVVCFLMSFFVQSQRGKLSERSKVSLITCAPGDNIHTSFGHTAIRIIDSAYHRDLVFNYGTFSYDRPFFFWAFLRGTLQYHLSVTTFRSFMKSYYRNKRGVYENDLILTYAQRQLLYKKMMTNYLPQNRYYRYEFFDDNCATRVRDLFLPFCKKRIFPPLNTSFRDAFESQLDEFPWWKFGTSLLLGVKADMPVDSVSAMFLPDILQSSFEHLSKHDVPLLKPMVILIDEPLVQSPAWLSPYWLGILLLLAVLWVSCYEIKRATYVQWFNRVLFSITGIFGWLFVFMWSITLHADMLYNWNVLWAFPPLFPLIFWALKSHMLYFWVAYSIMLVFVILPFFPFGFHPVIKILAAALLIRTASIIFFLLDKPMSFRMNYC